MKKTFSTSARFLIFFPRKFGPGKRIKPKKTKFIVFKPSQRRKSHDIQLLINDYKLDQVKETIFLGVIRDENLNWKSEISHVAN